MDQPAITGELASALSGFILSDNLSKFGTLVMVKKGLEIYPGMSRSVQVGRTVINFYLSYQ